MSLLPAERRDMLNIKNAFLLLVFLMLGDVSLNSNDADESLKDMFLHLLWPVEPSL